LPASKPTKQNFLIILVNKIILRSKTQSTVVLLIFANILPFQYGISH
jgi:hypothetical protein